MLRELRNTRQIVDQQRAILHTLVNGADNIRFKTLFCQMLAEAMAFVHDTTTSIQCIEQAIELGLVDLMWLEHCPLFQEIRKTSVYPELRKRVQHTIHQRASPIASQILP